MAIKNTVLPTPTLPPHSDGVNLTMKELLHLKQHAVKWLPPAKSLWSQMAGQHQSRQLGRGMDFSEVRQYQHGDDIRSIDWRVTARTGKPHTKLFSEEREKPVIVYVDFSPSMRFGSTLLLKSVQAAHFAALTGWIATEGQDRIGAVIDTGSTLTDLKPLARQRGALALNHALVNEHQKALMNHHVTQNSSMAPALEALNRLCPKGSDIILLSDFSRLTEQDEITLSGLNTHNRVRIVQLWDPLEQGVTDFRGCEQVTDRQHTQWIDFGKKTTRKNIEAAFKAKQNQLSRLALKLGMSVSALSSAQPLQQQLHGF
ncbi:DUF58 domain-containing protein [Vibrio cholerae]